MTWLRSLFAAAILLLCLAGCGSFRTYTIPELGPAAQTDQITGTKIYVQETLKPQDNGEFCTEWHGCLWHGKNTFGERLADQLAQLGAFSNFVGLSRQERAANNYFDEGGSLVAYQYSSTINDHGGHDIVPGTYKEQRTERRENPFIKKLEFNKTLKSNLRPDEYWIDSKIRYISNGAGEWFLKSLLGGFTFTMVPIWQKITTEVELSVTNYKQEVIWHKEYKDSYIGAVWFFFFPIISTAKTVPDAITDNIARIAVHDMVQAGLFRRKE